MTDIHTLYAAHKQWSEGAFKNVGPTGPLQHLIKEAEEALENPTDVEEYVDCLFLVLDASRRAGFDLAELVEAGFEKLEVLKQRHYPEAIEGQPCEHVKIKSLSDVIEVGGTS